MKINWGTVSPLLLLGMGFGVVYEAFSYEHRLTVLEDAVKYAKIERAEQKKAIVANTLQNQKDAAVNMQFEYTMKNAK